MIVLVKCRAGEESLWTYQAEDGRSIEKDTPLRRSGIMNQLERLTYIKTGKIVGLFLLANVAYVIQAYSTTANCTKYDHSVATI